MGVEYKCFDIVIIKSSQNRTQPYIQGDLSTGNTCTAVEQRMLIHLHAIYTYGIYSIRLHGWDSYRFQQINSLCVHTAYMQCWLISRFSNLSLVTKLMAHLCTKELQQRLCSCAVPSLPPFLSLQMYPITIVNPHKLCWPHPLHMHTAIIGIPQTCDSPRTYLIHGVQECSLLSTLLSGVHFLGGREEAFAPLSP